MSAKEAYKKPPIDIETLPDELLAEVFRHATWVPYGIDPSDLVIKRLQSSRAGEIVKEYRLSLVTRRYLIRACKKWYRLGLLYLYEWLLIRKAKNLQCIVDTAEAFLSGTDDVRIGWCTKRIDIGLRLTGGETQSHIDEIGPLLLRLLRAVPNLEVLTIGNCYDYSWIHPHVSHSYCPKLSTLNWVNNYKTLEPQTWHHFLHSHPNLIYINPSATTLSERHTPTLLTHTLLGWTTGFNSPIPINTCFTSLQRLSINLHGPSIADPPRYENLITCPIPSLDTLQLNFASFHRHMDLDFDLSTIQPIFRFFPNLRRVDLRGGAGCARMFGEAEETGDGVLVTDFGAYCERGAQAVYGADFG
ncbi:hypothetical protein P691DRAFT_766356 [Macrolepiota fuliginosa MF-IS2]|uniref:Uncharacterized protein n=1 Tax=Macrolepiota fuliginosa MF-IS2 TaxID=1400762 RepID=A0A9P5X128_9AGAR|nr:hypothetical protein P691DRAFT_766356 [Macrolepiota fuliginosa MF-IS2]